MERPERLGPSLEAAARFIEASASPDGFWSDFMTLAGESVYWVTGYVGYALAGGAPSGDEARRELLARAGAGILGSQGEDGGWGYGPGVPSDADSTSWCLLFLARLGAQRADSRERAVGFLRTHQNPLDGGFRTYARPSEVGRYMMLDRGVSFEGWSSSQMCVTPVAGRALLEAGSAEGVDKALEYVRKGQTAEGYWEPYWWSERLYATLNCIELLLAGGDERDAALVRKAQDWIAASQLGTGAWSDSTPGPGVPFSTALALRGLMATPRQEFSEIVAEGTEWLLTDQLTDGSWNSHHILRIPHPSTKEPWKQPFWTRDGKAINAVIKDHRRLYTTATAYAALSQLDRSLSGSGP